MEVPVERIIYREVPVPVYGEEKVVVKEVTVPVEVSIAFSRLLLSVDNTKNKSPSFHSLSTIVNNKRVQGHSTNWGIMLFLNR